MDGYFFLVLSWICISSTGKSTASGAAERWLKSWRSDLQLGSVTLRHACLPHDSFWLTKCDMTSCRRKKKEQAEAQWAIRAERETVSLTSEVLDKNPLSLCSGKTYPKVKFESNSLFLNQCYSKCIQELCWIRFPLSANVLVFKLEWKAMMTDRIFNTL